MKTKLLLTGLVFIAVTSLAAGQKTDTNTDNKQVNSEQWGPAFVDADNDGVCDNIDNPRAV